MGEENVRRWRGWVVAREIVTCSHAWRRKKRKRQDRFIVFWTNHLTSSAIVRRVRAKSRSRGRGGGKQRMSDDIALIYLFGASISSTIFKLMSAKFFPSPLKFVRPRQLTKRRLTPGRSSPPFGGDNQWLPACRARLPVNHFDTSVSMFLSVCFI